MSFYTSILLYRPTAPPRITGPDIAKFLRDLAALDVTAGEPVQACSVKFGRSIDQDDQDLVEEVPTESPVIFGSRRQSTDVELSGEPLLAVADSLAAFDRPVYRAHLSLPPLRDHGSQALYQPSSENSAAVCLDSLSLEIGPIVVGHMGVDVCYHVGWIAFSLHGGGYCFPRTRRQVIEAAGALEPIARLKELCRRTWPVPREAASQRTRKAREELSIADLWPYDAVDQPADWFWGIHESG